MHNHQFKIVVLRQVYKMEDLGAWWQKSSEFNVKQYGECTAAPVIRHSPTFDGIWLQNWELAEQQKWTKG